ncbi:MAG: hypothetical protein NC082_01240 [Clostridiales bacterium]|nr:hypothetical protein [Clostridiales bacterium]
MYQGSIERNSKYTFKQAVIACVDPSGGDILPSGIPPIPKAFFNNIVEMTPQEIAYVVVNALMGEDFSPEQLRSMVNEWVSDDCITVASAGTRVYAIESLSGSTMSEYDMAAKLFALILRYFYDHGMITVDTLFFAPSRGDSCAAMTYALKSVIGQAPIIIQTAGILTGVERRQLISLTPETHRNAVSCDEDSLEKLVRRAMSKPGFFEQHTPIALSSFNVVTLVSHVVSYFLAYMKARIAEIEGDIVIVVNENDTSACNAAMIAVELGLPISIIKASPLDDNNKAIVDAYASAGYILSPRSASVWNTATNIVEGNERAVALFVQSSHPAKSRGMLEPLLNRVIQLPHQLVYNEERYNKPKRMAPSIAAVKACLTNY